MCSISGLLIFGLVIFFGVALFGTAAYWFLATPVGTLLAVLIAAAWFNAGRRP